jgi:hypothetical protein
LRKWPEKAQRKTCWYDIGQASGLVTPKDLGEVLRHTARLLMVAPSRIDQSPDHPSRAYQGLAVPNVIPPIC